VREDVVASLREGSYANFISNSRYYSKKNQLNIKNKFYLFVLSACIVCLFPPYMLKPLKVTTVELGIIWLGLEGKGNVIAKLNT
jgi:hypothetical protein